VGKAAVAVIAVALLAACTTGSLPASAGPTPPNSTSEGQPRCEDVPLRGQDGELVFLTGRWIGSVDPNAVPRPSVYYIRQTNSCVVWVGLSQEAGEAPGDSWIETFTGNIRSDFTIVGLWDELPGGGRGAITVEIRFVPVDGQFEVELHLRSSTGSIHPIKRWVREETVN
jgi:hypothetical protein